MSQVLGEFGAIFAQAQGQQGGAGSMMSSMLIMLPLFAIMYFLWIRPQQKKQKEHDQMLTKIKAGDRVMTTCGLLGTVVRVSDNKVTLEIAEKVHVDFVQAAIANILENDKDASLPDNK